MNIRDCYCYQSGHQIGPLSREEIAAMITSGRLAPTDMVFVPPATQWIAVQQYCGAGAAPPPPPIPGFPQASQSWGQPQKTCGLAIGALICGILGLLLLLPALPAIILGHIALSKIRSSTGRLAGQGQAIAGLVMGYMMVALIPMIGLMAAIAVPSFIRARIRSQATTVLNECRMLDAAVDQYALENNKSGEVVPMIADLTPYLKAGSKLAVSGGNDSLGNAITISAISGGGIKVSRASKEALSAATGGDAFWGPYTDTPSR